MIRVLKTRGQLLAVLCVADVVNTEDASEVFCLIHALLNCSVTHVLPKCSATCMLLVLLCYLNHFENTCKSCFYRLITVI